MSTENPKHGGRRDGAGRKPTLTDSERKRPVTYRLSPDVYGFLKSISNQTAYVEKCIRESRDFKKSRSQQ